MAKKLKTFQFNLINVLILYSIIGVLGVGSVEPIFKAVLLCFRGGGCSLFTNPFYFHRKLYNKSLIKQKRGVLFMFSGTDPDL